MYIHRNINHFHLTIRNYTILDSPILYTSIIPHHTILDIHVFQHTIIPDGYIRANGAIFEGNAFPNNARGDQLDVVYGIPLVNNNLVNVVEFVFIL